MKKKKTVHSYDEVMCRKGRITTENVVILSYGYGK